MRRYFPLVVFVVCFLAFGLGMQFRETRRIIGFVAEWLIAGVWWWCANHFVRPAWREYRKNGYDSANLRFWVLALAAAAVFIYGLMFHPHWFDNPDFE